MSGPGNGDRVGPAGDPEQVDAGGSLGSGRSSATGTDSGPRVARRQRTVRPVAGRTAALAVVVVVLLGVGVVSWVAPPPAAPGAAATGDASVVAPADAHAASFFCATGVGEDAGGGAQESIVLTNSTDSAAVGVASTVYTSGATPATTGVRVPARGSSVVTPPAGPAGTASATRFSFGQGGVTGTAIVSGPQGWSTAPCATQVASQWDFAGGSTATGLLDLSLYNPSAAAAMVDVTFLTVGGTVLDPQAYQGIALAPGQLVVEGLGAYVQNQSVVATLVEATSGSLVATELDDMVVPSGSGLALLPGVPNPASTWSFAQTTAVAGGSVTLAVANPGTAPVTAEVTAGLPGASVVPHQLVVPGRSVATFAPSATAGWPLGAPYSLTVTATGPVVVGRTVVAPAGAAAPQGGITTGTTSPASSWLVVGPGATGSPAVAGALIHTLAIANRGTAPVVASVTPLRTGVPVATVRVPALGVVVIGQAVLGELQPLTVSASGPVTVETDDAPTGAPGVAAFGGFALHG